MKKNYFDQKVKGCEYLVNLNTKRINKTHIISAAEKVNIPTNIMERAWNNFVQTGGKFVDKRLKNGKKGYIPMKPSVKCNITKERPLTSKEAASILLRYMTEKDINSRQLCNESKIPLNQFYRWIKELNVKGTLLDKTILNHRKYAKINVLDAIWFYKRPETKRKSIINLTATEKMAYKRVGDVLVHYLSAM